MLPIGIYTKTDTNPTTRVMKKNSLYDVLAEAATGLAESLGYDDLLNLLYSVFAVRNWLVFLESAVLSLAVTLALSLTSFVESYMYAPLHGLIIFNILILCESNSGAYVVVKVKKNKFDLGKFVRGGAKMVGQNLVLYLAFNMAQSSDVYVWLPIFIWTLFTGVNFAKTLRNMAISGLLDGELADLLLRQFADKYQLNTDISLRDKKDNEQDSNDPTN